MKIQRFMKQMRLLEQLLEDNFGANGATFAAKVIEVTPQLPKGIVEKLSFLANLYDGVREDKTPPDADLKQAGYWINAAYPYISNGAPMPKSALSRVLSGVVKLVVLAILVCAAWFFWRR